MFFDNLLTSLNKEEAYFRCVEIHDVNQLSGNAKVRTVYPQSDTMRLLQSRIRRWVRKQYVVRCSSATGALPGSSPEKNITAHRRKDSGGNYYFPRYFLLMDIHDAYKSVSLEKLAGILCTFETALSSKKEEILSFLKTYCSSDGQGLVVGAGASQDLFNVYCEVVIDRELRVFCDKHAITYTRYIDDMTFSCNESIGKGKRKALRKIIQDSGLPLHLKKIHYYDLTKGTITVNGMGLDIHGNIFTPRKYLRTLCGLMHRSLRDESIDKRMVIGKIDVFHRALKAKRRSPNATEAKILKQCAHFKLVWENSIKTVS